ncbi:MAG: MBL fold metallo-hydrolase [Anaerolineales bacterium]|jgi:7,8-dihydropterin-6-yl-methyl-4-(beta-D-ribofuranosyl)aminobenzene 5'-phosphate synthase
MKITTLIENTARSESTLHPEHGLSLHIAFDDRQLLFDTGASDAFSQNADRLGIDLRSVDAVVLSHYHFDHSGGLTRFFERNQSAAVYLTSPPDGDCYFKAFSLLKRYIGVDPNLLSDHGPRFSYVDEKTEILPNVHILPKIHNTHPLPKGNKYIFIKRDDEWLLDDFEHELICVIEDQGNLVAFTGCSHSGIINMIDTVQAAFPGRSIEAVIGGFHLTGIPIFNTMAGSKSEVAALGRSLLNYPVDKYYTGHCTGEKAFQVLKEVMGNKLDSLHTGLCFEV